MSEVKLGRHACKKGQYNYTYFNYHCFITQSLKKNETLCYWWLLKSKAEYYCKNDYVVVYNTVNNVNIICSYQKVFVSA